MDTTDKKILNILQKGLPLIETTFLSIGKDAGISEEECIKRIQRLKDEQIIRQISAIFDTKSLGYKGSLVAMKFSPYKLEEAAAIISKHPGVTHNYERNHEMNLWFTIAVPPSCSLEKHIRLLGELANAGFVFILPTLKLFKIGVNLDLTEDCEKTESSEKNNYYSEANQGQGNAVLTGLEKRIICELQKDIALKTKPFNEIAERCGIAVQDLLQKAEEFKKRGIMRRFAAVLRHRKAGFTANIMGIWEAPEERVEECGTIMASYKAVSHCYHRPTYPDWPYSLFTMIHEKSMERCEAVIKDIACKTNINDYVMLHSTREFKKVRMKYFTDDIEKWERENFENCL